MPDRPRARPRPPPPEDRVRSPRAGWDRRHWEAQADRLLDGLLPFASPSFASPSFAGYALPGRASWSGPASDALEGFARSFLLAGFRIAGAGGAGEPAARLLERYAAALHRPRRRRRRPAGAQRHGGLDAAAGAGGGPGGRAPADQRSATPAHGYSF